MTARRPAVSNPADLLLRVSRTPDGLRLTSPQLPGWAAVARGPVPIAQAVDSGFTELACAAYAGARGARYDLEVWDAGADALAASGAVLTGEDVVVVRSGSRPRNDAGRFMRPNATRGARHDPWDWTDLGDGFWLSPARHRYPVSSPQVQKVIAARAREAAGDGDGGVVQQTLDDVAS